LTKTNREFEKLRRRFNGDIAFFLRFPKGALLMLYNRELPKLIHLPKLPVPPTDIQHSVVNEDAVVSLLEGDLILDCGCGIGRWGYILRGKRREMIGFDISRDYLKLARQTRAYAGLIQASASHLPFSSDTFNTSLAVEILEHMNKKEGEIFLAELKRVVSRRIILSTPEGFFPLFFGTESPETHRSGWLRGELRKQGFRCEIASWHGNRWLLCVWQK
jgi:SAM-dependent methyltransferase